MYLYIALPYALDLPVNNSSCHTIYVASPLSLCSGMLLQRHHKDIPLGQHERETEFVIYVCIQPWPKLLGTLYFFN